MKNTWRVLAVLALFIALSVAHTWPLASLAASHVTGGRDGVTGTWALYDLTSQLIGDPVRLMDGNNLYPYSDSLAVLDHQLGNALLAAPLVAAGASPALTYNVSILLTFVLSGFFTCLLAYRLTGSWLAGVVAGCAFAFGTFRSSSIVHAHVLATQWLPLALLMLHRFLERPGWRRWMALTGATLLVALSSWHIAVLGSAAIGLVAIWTMAGDGRPLRTRAVGLCLTAAICGAALAPLAMTYSRVGRHWPLQTPEGRELLGTVVKYSADLSSLVTLPVGSRAPYASVLSFLGSDRPGVFPGLMALALALLAIKLLVDRREQHTRWATPLRALLALGAALSLLVTLAALAGQCCTPVVAVLSPLAPFVVLGLGLAVAGLVSARRLGRRAPALQPILTYAALGVGGALLALGPRVHVAGTDVGSGLWRLDLLPLPLLMRNPLRFALLISLGVAILAGFGIAHALRNMPPRRAAALALGVLLLLNVDLAFDRIQASPAPVPTAVDAWLAETPQEGAMIVYPLVGTNFANYSSQLLGRRVVNGAGYLAPPQLYQVEALPDLSDEQLEMLWRQFHPRFVVIRGDRYPDKNVEALIASIAARPQTFQLRAQDGNDYVYELTDRGRGAALWREWPRTELDRLGDEMHIEGEVVVGRPGTIAELRVSVNGHPLLYLSGEDAVGPFSRSLPFDANQLVDGINTFEILAGYRFAPETDPHPIGTTGVSLPADVSVLSDRERSLVEVNGEFLAGEKGYLLVELDPETGAVARSAHFNTSWYEEASRELAAFVRRVPTGAPVVVVSEFDVSREMTARTVKALRDLGLEADLRKREGFAHAAIGVKGATPGTALELTDTERVLLTLGQIDPAEVRLSTLRIEPSGARPADR